MENRKKKRFMEASDREIKRLFDNLLPKIQERSKCICLMKLIGGLQNKLTPFRLAGISNDNNLS